MDPVTFALVPLALVVLALAATDANRMQSNDGPVFHKW